MKVVEFSKKSDISLQLLMMFPKNFENVNLLIDTSGSIPIPAVIKTGSHIQNALSAIGFVGVINILQFDLSITKEILGTKKENLTDILYSMTYYGQGGSLLKPALDAVKERQKSSQSYRNSINIIVSDGEFFDYKSANPDDIMIKLVDGH